MADSALPLAPTVASILEEKSLKWIFVGGKGGVGKTTTSCCLATLLAQQRASVLIVSTDPAHNLSDAFGQKFSKNPTPVDGVPNLSAMEIDPTVEVEESDLKGGMSSFLSEVASTFPGIDEAMSFAQLLTLVKSLDFECVVFDTAPTGHTLRLLALPSVVDSCLGKLMEMRARFAPIMGQMQGMFPMLQGASEESIVEQMTETKANVQKIIAEFQDPTRTTFVCVCISEFLSVFETERLVQELVKQKMDSQTIVVNQLIFPPSGSTCGLCRARVAMQRKYLAQIEELYEDFHVVKMPLLPEEIRGVQAIRSFSRHLVTPYSAD